MLFFTLFTSIMINESITMFGSSIQFSQIYCSFVSCFLHINIWYFEHIFHQLVVQVLSLCLQTIISTHLKHLSNVGLKFSGWGQVNTSLIPGTCLTLLIIVILNPFDWLFLLLIAGKTNPFLRL